MTTDWKLQNSLHAIVTFKTAIEADAWNRSSAGDGEQLGTTVVTNVECSWSTANKLAADLEECDNAVTKSWSFYNIEKKA